MASQSKQAARSHEGAPQDAIEMLVTDHKKVKALFSEFDKLKKEDDDGPKAELVSQICKELTVHAAIEEEIFYPAIREAVNELDLMDEALVEHAGAKSLIAQLEEMEPTDDLYDANVTVLREQIEHHVKEEEGEMFKRTKEAEVDTETLGKKMMERKIELIGELGLGNGEDADEEEDTHRSARQTQRKAATEAKAR
jgi:hemerythrin superfamily protein